jgi:hypothetical protein
MFELKFYNLKDGNINWIKICLLKNTLTRESFPFLFHKDRNVNKVSGLKKGIELFLRMVKSKREAVSQLGIAVILILDEVIVC